MSDEAGEVTGIIVLDGDAGERERIEGMAEALGVEVWAATPQDLVPERADTWESLMHARAVVAAAEFGGRNGLELIAWLAWNARPKPSVLALSLDRAHRIWVEAALRAGADTCLLRPIDAEEFKTKVVDASAVVAEERSDAEAEPEASEETRSAAGSAGEEA